MFNANKSEKIANKLDFTEYDRDAALAYRSVRMKAEHNLAGVVAAHFPEQPKNVQPIGTISLASHSQTVKDADNLEVQMARELVERAQAQSENPLMQGYRDDQEAA